uniref:C-type lectin domain-containing protein n=1 Tax=Echeneis naucrates TaxID=173247 RepID=A0A665V1W6_ECHNA
MRSVPDCEVTVMMLLGSIHKPLLYLTLSIKCTTENIWCLGWKYFRSSCYYVSTETKSWNASRNECLKKGADLVIVSTDEEQEFLIELNKSIWIGLTDEEEEGVWKWVDGTTPTKRYWRSQHPDNAGGENCAAVQNTGSNLSKWNDLPCSHKLYGVCEKKKPVEEQH